MRMRDQSAQVIEFPKQPAVAPPVGDATLSVLVDAIAEKVAAKVRVMLADRESRVQPVLLTVADAAVYIGRTEVAVQHLVFEKQIPVVRHGRRVHLDRRDLDRWIEAHKL